MLEQRKEGDVLMYGVMDDPEKQPSRELMCGLFARHINGPCKILNLPGYYALENTLKHYIETPGLQFVGVERRESTFYGAKAHMPGDKCTWTHVSYKTPKQTRWTEALRTTEATLIKLPLARFIEQMYRQPVWLANYGNWKGAWFDFCSELCESNLRTVFEAGNYFDPATPAAPAAFTFMCKREKNGWLKELLKENASVEERYALFNFGMKHIYTTAQDDTAREWYPIGYYSYQNDNNTSMCVAYGYFCARGHQPPKDSVEWFAHQKRLFR